MCGVEPRRLCDIERSLREAVLQVLIIQNHCLAYGIIYYYTHYNGNTIQKHACITLRKEKTLRKHSLHTRKIEAMGKGLIGLIQMCMY